MAYAPPAEEMRRHDSHLRNIALMPEILEKGSLPLRCGFPMPLEHMENLLVSRRVVRPV